MATMAISSAAAVPQTTLEDPLGHLPCSTIAEYKKGQRIYNQERPSTGLCLIIDGKVKVSRVADDGSEVVVDIYRTDEFFGESALLGPMRLSEEATALETTKLMSWTAAEIEEIAARRPKLAVALWQILAQRTVDFGHRIESFSLDNAARRLARSLICLSMRLGEPDDIGSLRMAAMTHELLSRYVGTSREIVTHYMNYFRRMGYLQYSRKGITVYGDALQEWLKEDSSLVELHQTSS
jgi:CRP/FNR family cyclic AMP-dependent transcriptional regulator